MQGYFGGGGGDGGGGGRTIGRCDHINNISKECSHILNAGKYTDATKCPVRLFTGNRQSTWLD